MKTQSEVLTGWIAFCEINRLRKVFQPFTWCCDSRLRWGWQCDWNTLRVESNIPWVL